MTTTTAHCRQCGKPFPASRTGYTVHCPEHRGRRATATTAAATVALILCRCGKTVLAGPGVTAGTTCPRGC